MVHQLTHRIFGEFNFSTWWRWSQFQEWIPGESEEKKVNGNSEKFIKLTKVRLG